MKRKTIKTLILGLLCMLISVSTVFAATYSGWEYDYGNWRYMNTNNTWITNNWIYDNDSWYYMDCYGEMCVGWFKTAIPANSYYLNNNGELSLCQESNIMESKWYYFDSNGALANSSTEEPKEILEAANTVVNGTNENIEYYRTYTRNDVTLYDFSVVGSTKHYYYNSLIDRIYVLSNGSALNFNDMFNSNCPSNL